MRTTLTLSDDLAQRAKRDAAHLNRPFKDVINLALRLGLESLEQKPVAKPYRTQPKPMGLREGLSYDNVAELLSLAEQEDYR